MSARHTETLLKEERRGLELQCVLLRRREGGMRVPEAEREEEEGRKPVSHPAVRACSRQQVPELPLKKKKTHLHC